jgi:hypothetical protein
MRIQMLSLISRKWFALFPLALVLIIAACSSGGGDDSSDQAADQDGGEEQATAVAADEPDGETDGEVKADNDRADDAVAAPALADDSDYARRLRAIVEDIERRLDEAADEFQDEAFAALADIDLDDEDALNQVLIDALATIGPSLLQIIDDGLDDVDGLDPPDRFEEDHDRFVGTIRQLFELQSDIFERAQEDGFSADQQLEDLTTRIDELENDLRDSISPEYFNIIAPFFDDFDDETESLADLGGDDGVTLTQGDASISAGGDIPDNYPDELTPPNATLESAFAATEGGVESIVAFWTSTSDADDLLDFFADAFQKLGIEGEEDRVSAGDFNALSISDGDGNPLAGVLISPSASGGTYDVIVTLIGS